MIAASDFNALIPLGSATLFGAIIGLNRQLHRKPAGLRTHALVSLGSALAALMVSRLAHGDPNAASRVLQGAVTGIGFIGAGVIMHHDAESRVEGLTTAASVWVAAMVGLGCGAGLVVEATLALGLTMFLLIAGGHIEHAFARFFAGEPEQKAAARDSAGTDCNNIEA